MTITDTVKEWQNFYFALAGVTATLMGLLFVALSINSSKIHDQNNVDFLKLARLTFSNYLMLLVFSLQMLVPVRSVWQLTAPLIGIGLIGLFWTYSLRLKGHDKRSPHSSFLRRSFIMSSIAYVSVLFVVAIGFQTVSLTLYFLLTPLMLLVVNSIRNSWGLMMMLSAKAE